MVGNAAQIWCSSFLFGERHHDRVTDRAWYQHRELANFGGCHEKTGSRDRVHSTLSTFPLNGEQLARLQHPQAHTGTRVTAHSVDLGPTSVAHPSICVTDSSALRAHLLRELSHTGHCCARLMEPCRPIHNNDDASKTVMQYASCVSTCSPRCRCRSWHTGWCMRNRARMVPSSNMPVASIKCIYHQPLSDLTVTYAVLNMSIAFHSRRSLSFDHSGVPHGIGVLRQPRKRVT